MWSQKKKKLCWSDKCDCSAETTLTRQGFWVETGHVLWGGRGGLEPWMNRPLPHSSPPLLSPSSQSLLSWRLAAETRRSRSRPDPTTEMCIAVSVQVVSHANTTPVWWMLGSNPSDAIYVQNLRAFLHQYTNGNRIEVQYAAFCCSFTMW